MNLRSPTDPPSIPLAGLLADAGRALHRHEPPPQVAQAMWAAFEARHPTAPVPARGFAAWRARWQRRSSTLAWTLCGGALAASLLALVLDPRVPEVDTSRRAATAFMPVGSPEHWRELQLDARESRAAWVVNTELPRASLAAMGLPYDPARAAEPVRAELLLHSSGEVLAVRFVQ